MPTGIKLFREFRGTLSFCILILVKISVSTELLSPVKNEVVLGKSRDDASGAWETFKSTLLPMEFRCLQGQAATQLGSQDQNLNICV